MTKFFDGKALAQDIMAQLKVKVEDIRTYGINPHLVSIQVGENTQSEVFLKLKKKYAEKIGVYMEIKKFTGKEKFEDILKFINEVNADPRVNGVMIQLPISDNYDPIEKSALISTIDTDKDIDGMRSDSPFIAPVVKAVLTVIKESGNVSGLVGVVGAKGFVGRKIVHRLEELERDVRRIDVNDHLTEMLMDCEVVITATGRVDLIKKDMVKTGVVLIDVGAPKGEISQGVYEKASFISPVPGGVGPLTVSYLFENLVESVYPTPA
jgi:methylenetetrahydrofolate dehydrogenase (NADP+)/methenyltetrahydrofolate cyclohydrolase